MNIFGYKKKKSKENQVKTEPHYTESQLIILKDMLNKEKHLNLIVYGKETK